jgi:N-acetylglucosamine-6-phosphate deacetylase
MEKKSYPNILSYLQPMPGGSHGSNILGIHLEGPFFAIEKYGAHSKEVIISHLEAFENFYDHLTGVKIVTLAPELPGALEAIEFLKSKDIVVAAGHTNAGYESALLALKSGVTMATHLYNAMPPISHRNPGIIEAILTSDEVYYSVIADGVHVKPSAINLAWRSNPKGFFLVTDAMEALGQHPGIYNLGSMQVEVREGVAYILGTQTIAGSVLSLDQGVRNFRSYTGCSVADAIEAASLKPARILGLKNKGHLDAGSDADFILLNADLEVQATFIQGQLAWKSSSIDGF